MPMAHPISVRGGVGRRGEELAPRKIEVGKIIDVNRAKR